LSDYCKSCGARLTPNAAFCGACGAPNELWGSAANLSETDERESPLSPTAFLKASLREGFALIKQLIKNPKELIPMLILSIIWLVLSILPALGVNPWPVRLLSFLTFAQGGMYGGVWGAFGGLIGKVVFAYFASVLILPLFCGKNPLKGLGRGWKEFFSGLAISGINAVVPLVLGVGAALIAFNFLTGNAGAVNSMAGIAGFLLAVRSLTRRGGFLWGLTLSIANSLSKGRIPAPVTVSRAIAGCAAGSAMGTALSFLRIPWLPYALGALLLVTGFALALAVKSGKGAVSA
jgi:hypothetical protein